MRRRVTQLPLQLLRRVGFSLDLPSWPFTMLFDMLLFFVCFFVLSSMRHRFLDLPQEGLIPQPLRAGRTAARSEKVEQVNPMVSVCCWGSDGKLSPK